LAVNEPPEIEVPSLHRNENVPETDVEEDEVTVIVPDLATLVLVTIASG
jgi:hypothetical protein